MSEFFEAIWNGQGIGDGADLEEVLQAYLVVKPEDGDWIKACAVHNAASNLIVTSSQESAWYLAGDICSPQGSIGAPQGQGQQEAPTT